ncbi:MAG TPA: hypothetical protein VNW97_12595 [Candidatus Saccharimonadales bacterium]|jgi:hypothetical protein|nr:hypothetical protein [Candidatus Saccharimonadales bacterium]
MQLTKNYHSLLSMAVLAGTAGAGLFLAEVRKGDYATETLSQLNQAEAPAALAGDSVYEVSAYPLYPPTLAEGEGREETEAYCSPCHSTRYITMQPPLAAATWEAEVNKMRKAFGAPIPEPSAAKITQYLQSHYTPGTRK